MGAKILGRFRWPSLSGAPASPTNNEGWYDTALARFRVRENGVTFNITDSYATPTTRAVVIGTAVQPSVNFVTIVSVPGVVTHGASADGELRLQISPDNVTYYTVDSMGGAGIRDALSTAATDRGTLQWEVPPGWYYKVISVTNNGAPTFSVGTAVEQSR